MTEDGTFIAAMVVIKTAVALPFSASSKPVGSAFFRYLPLAFKKPAKAVPSPCSGEVSLDQAGQGCAQSNLENFQAHSLPNICF